MHYSRAEHGPQPPESATEHATEQHCKAIILFQTVDTGG